MSKGFVFTALAVLAWSALTSTSATAAIVPTLETRTASGPYTLFSYDPILTFDEGLSKSVISTETNTFVGSKLVIFDFAGYVAGSIFSTNSLFTTSVENVSTGLAMPPGATDAASIVNLVFTYNGPDFRTTGGTSSSGNPYSSLDLGTFGAASLFSGTAISFASSIGVKNYVAPYPQGTANTAAFSANSVLVPAGAVPEPATWAMMVIGFGAMGALLRASRQSPGRQLA
jgi:hypothetical protein